MLNGSVITNVEYYKFLGIIIDEKLSFKYHINELCGKLSRTVGAVRKVAKFVPSSLLRSLYFTMFYSNLVYGISAWGGAGVTLINRVKMIHERIIKLLPHNNNSFLENKILSFENTYKYFVLLKMHKIVNGKDEYFSPLIADLHPLHSYSTRSAEQGILNLPLHRKSKCQSSIIFKGVTFWNSLPVNIKDIQDYNKYKYILKQFLL